MADLNKSIDRSMTISRNVAGTLSRRVKDACSAYGEALRRAQSAYAQSAFPGANVQQWWVDWAQYWVDAGQRSALFWDTIRERGNQWLAHEEAGKPPPLHYRYEMLADARTFENPCNYALVRIVPPKGMAIDEAKRPFIIIDPRAGHGPGIGGFKEDSEVGVALGAGHPVYFVIFFPDPVPGQTLADVTDAEAEFVRIVAERHPDSPKPSLIGNCQGGWAVMMLAAARPDMTGPLVINGAPMSYWAGNDGDNPMRYAGGLLGGSWVSLFASDLGAGTFDGAHLVANFESLNPANTFWDKYYLLYDDVDDEAPRFLEFERWWGGFYLLNEEEIRWIVNNLFVGNKLSQGEARLGPGRYFDLKSIKQPIIVFASMGDNITPPQQAFNWIADLYSSTDEIKAAGQTIVGLIHEDIGHLGIFVSGKVAKKEHTQILEVLKYIQALPPGLYGMEIHEIQRANGEVAYDVTLHERSLEDLKKLQKYDRVDEKPFEAVAALSELTERAYELLVRPAIRDAVPEWLARALRELHPLRAQRWMLSDRNPMLAGVPAAAAMARALRQPRSPHNAGRRAERLGSAVVSASLDLYRDLRDAASEAAFFQIYGNMMSLQMADQRAAIRRQTRFDPRSLPAVRQVLDDLDRGGLPEAIVRAGLLVAKAGGGKRRLAQMEGVRALLAPTGVLEGVSEDDFRRVLHDEAIVVEFEPAQAKRALPRLVRSTADRRKLHRMLDALADDPHLDKRQHELVGELRKLAPADARTAAPRRRAPAGKSRSRAPKGAGRPRAQGRLRDSA
ncbi:Poly(3-hydroxyalkanoate) polymerase subunit PhaC [Burkholderiales bacterium]|nr:Poly(3-hydroxyalkanoate) polymerase subunit PhaC [Burkholderiales bacterium]